MFVAFCTVTSSLLYYIGLVSRALYLESETTILELQKKHKSVAAMESAARERTFLLVKMFNEEDVFIRDEMHREFDMQAYRFIRNRDVLLGMNLNNKERGALKDILEIIKQAQIYDTQAADFMMEGKVKEAELLLFNEAIPRLYNIIERFVFLLGLVDDENQAELLKLRSQLKHNLYAIFLLTTLFLLAAVSLIYYSLKRIKKGADMLSGSEAIKDSILDTAMDAILSVDEKGIVSQFNRSAEKMFGYRVDEMLGESVEKILLEEFKDRLDELKMAEVKFKNNYLSGISHDVFGAHKNATRIPLQISMSDTGVDGASQYSLIIRDLTDIKKSEEALKQRTEELEFANTKYKQLSETDPLTQISNRRVYEDRITNEIHIAKRSATSISLLMIDVDFFKKFNDTYGHDSGDVALIRVAKTIVESLPRSTDLAVRFGGEEFLVLMPVTKIDGALTVAERIRSNIKALAIPHVHSETAPVVTVSVGLTSLTGELLNEIDLIKQADTALYVAKANGRNRCEVFVKEKTV